MIEVEAREREARTREISGARERVGWYFWTAEVFRRSLHRLKEGKQWPFYFDFDLLVQNPSSCESVITLYSEEMNKLCRTRRVDALAFIEKADGGTVGAIALAGAIAIKTDIPHLPVRLARQVSAERVKASDPDLPLGQRLRGKNLVVVTDHVSHGGEVLKAVRAIRENGGAVSDVVTFTAFSEGLDSTKRRLQEEGITLGPIFRLPNDLQEDLRLELEMELQSSVAR